MTNTRRSDLPPPPDRRFHRRVPWAMGIAITIQTIRLPGVAPVVQLDHRPSASTTAGFRWPVPPEYNDKRIRGYLDYSPVISSPTLLEV